MPPRISILVPALLGLLAAGCGSPGHTVRLGLAPDDATLVTVLGPSPLVTVTNEGPDVVDVDWAPNTGGDRQSLGVAAAARTVQGPAQIVIRTGSGKGARILVVAERAEGLSVRLNPPELKDPPLKP